VKCKRVPLSTLRPGATLMAAIEDPINPGIKLLTKGASITQEFIDRLGARNITSVILSQRDLAVMKAFSSQGRRKTVPPAPHYLQSTDKNDFSEATDALVESADLSLKPIEKPVIAELQRQENAPYAAGLQMAWAQESNQQVDSVDEFFADTATRGWSDVTPLRQTCQTLLQRIAEDQDAFVCLAATPYESDYPSRHGFHVAGAALSIGVQMGLDREHLLDLGLGCLIHDVGMKSVGLAIFNTKTPLSHGQLKRLADHPVRAIEIAGQYGDAVSERAKLVAYQIHERLDGSGYPRGRTSAEIEPLAKIAAVADSFVGMLANRKHRAAILGYYVMAKLLDEVKQHKLDARAMRALIQVASLYPLGSYVMLENECIGKVIRSGHDAYTRPTIEMWHKDHLNQQPVIINLKHESMQILQPIAAPQAA
jgi:HD-GYP domain-containing protein (c-di-GMP phosphodiesterase class II)